MIIKWNGESRGEPERDEFQAGAGSASSLAKEQRETVVV
jgi:hypothetical protein